MRSLRLNVSVMRSHPVRDVGSCSSEAIPYLRGIIGAYDSLEDDEMLMFMHGHSVTWHTPYPLAKQLSLLMKTEYAYSAFGGVYCFFTDKFAAYQLYERAIHSQQERGVPAQPEQSVWDLVFNGTRWQYPAAPITHMWYPCCSTFFTQGWAVTRAPKREYERVLDNILDACRVRDWAPGQYDRNTTRALGNGPAGRVLEGAWHLMFGGATNVTIPPYCKVSDDNPLKLLQTTVPAGVVPRGRRLLVANASRHSSCGW